MPWNINMDTFQKQVIVRNYDNQLSIGTDQQSHYLLSFQLGKPQAMKNQAYSLWESLLWQRQKVKSDLEDLVVLVDR